MDPKPPSPSPPVPPLPGFDDPWQIRTRPANFEGLIAAREVLSLNHLRDMSGQRNVYCVRDGTKFACSPDQLQGLQKYLANLAHLIQEEGEREELEFEWSSPLSGRPGRFFKLGGLDKELAMATFLHAALLRQLAHQAVADLLGLSPGSARAEPGSADAAAALAGAVAQLRQAAGVHQHLAERVLPPLVTKLRGDRPGEVTPPLNAAMALTCLGEAQALTAFRAGARAGGSAGVAASLQAGAAELFEQAAKLLREAADDHGVAVGDRFRRYVAIASSLAVARAHTAMAVELHDLKMEAGAASRGLGEAEALLATAASAADCDAGWRGLVEAERANVQRIKAPIESDRLVVFVQPLPPQPQPLPAAKVLVSAVEWAAPQQ